MNGEPLSTRTAIVALVLVISVAAGGAVSALVRYDLIGYGHLPRAALIGLLLLLVVNAFTRLCRRRLAFSPGQILYVYLAVLVMAGFPGQQLVTYLYTSLVGPAYYVGPENRWREMFFEYIPAWTVPSLSAEAPAVKWAFLGMPSAASFPWQAWVVPLAVWSTFFVLLMLNYVFLASLFQRQWIERQRMLFPLATIPVELVKYQGQEIVPRVFKSGLFWAAFLIPFCVYSWNALHYHYPTMTLIDLRPQLPQVFGGRPWNELNGLRFNIYFDAIGITYLLPGEIGFSLWFFWVLKNMLRVARNATGYTQHVPFFGDVGVGSYLLLGLSTVWLARRSLRDTYLRTVGRCAQKQGKSEDAEGQDLVRPAVAFWGFGATFVGLLIFCGLLGVDWKLALFMLSIFLLSSLVVSRLVSEAGIFVVWSPLWSAWVGQDFVTKMFGAGALGARNITALSLVNIQIGDTASLALASIFQGYKVVSSGALQRRHALVLVCVALAVGIVASHPASLYAIYSRGIPALGWWLRDSGTILPNSIARNLENPASMFTAGNYGNMALGAGIIMLLNLLHTRFLWWPLHPLAWAATFSSVVSERFGFAFLSGWLLGRMATKVGGYVTYRRFRPFVIGLIVGHGTTLLIWTVIHYFYPISAALVME